MVEGRRTHELGVDSPSRESAPGSFVWSDGRIALACGALALLVGLWAWEPVAAGVWHDDGAYLLLSKSLAEGEGLTHAGVPGNPPGAKFPPLYPTLLALAWVVAPGATASGVGGGLLNVIFLSLAAAASWITARRGFGLARGPAALALLPWASPDLWRLGMISLSEPLFVLLLVGAVGWAARLLRTPAGEDDPLALALALGVTLGLLSLTRTIGLVVAAAAVAALCLGRRLRSGAVVAGSVAALVLPWLLWSRASAAALAEPLRELMGPYTRWLAAQYLADPVAALERAVHATPLLASISGSLFLPGSSGSTALFAGVVLGAGLAWGVWRSGRTGRFLLLTLVAYGLVLWAWPHVERRLVAPALPLLSLGVALLSARALEAPERPRRVLVGALGLWSAVFLATGLSELSADRHLEAYRVREVMLARSVVAIEGAVPPDAVVGAPELWGGVHLYTGRPAAPSARFIPMAPHAAGEPEEQFELWHTLGLDFVLLEHGGRVHRDAMDTLDAQCPGAVQLNASWEGGLLVRLAWDGACRESLEL